MPPLPTLEPAGEFVSGMSQIPEGEQLYLEWWVSYYGENLREHGCLEVYIDNPFIEVCKHSLEGSDQESTPAIIGILRTGYDRQGDLGSGVSVEYHEIDGLPYNITTARGDVVIHAVDVEGAIVAQSGGGFWAEPGKSWMYRVEDDSDPACYAINTFRLTNNGWLADCEHDCQ